MLSTPAAAQSARPIAPGGGRLAGFLAGSAALGSLIIAVLVVLADLEDEPDSGYDEWVEDEDPECEPARPSSSRRPSRRG